MIFQFSAKNFDTDSRYYILLHIFAEYKTEEKQGATSKPQSPFIREQLK